MPLTSSREMLLSARKDGYAIAAFNIENMEMAIAVIEAAEEAHAPVIIQTTPSTIRYASLDLYYANVAAIATKAKVPVVLHLDHADNFELIEEAVRSGYTSVMIDGSRLSYDLNTELTRRTVTMANLRGVPVEAELGVLGGKEDDVESSANACTDPVEAGLFAANTGISSLAVSIGTAHGVYTSVPNLDIERLVEIKMRVDIPLVLHGASGLSDDDVAVCIEEGICKVNYATELRVAYSDGVKEVLSKNPHVYDPKVYGLVAREKVKQVCVSKMKLCGCAGRI